MNDLVFMEPSNQLTNKYYENLAKIIKSSGYTPLPASDFWSTPWKLRQRKQTFILSWIEDRVARPKYTQSIHEFLLTLYKLAVIKIYSHKLIWIKHNYQPHSLNESVLTSSVLHKILVLCLASISNKKISHSKAFCDKNKDFSYVPHPMYETNIPKLEKDIPFLIFGKIMRYKGILEILEFWPQGKRLCIAGKPEDQSLQNEILKKITLRKLTVDFSPRFLSTDELDTLLSRTSCVICANLEKSMIASGVVVHALSAQCFVLARESDFTSELETDGCAIRTFSNMQQLSRIVTDMAYDDSPHKHERFLNLFNNLSVSNSLKSLLDNNP